MSGQENFEGHMVFHYGHVGVLLPPLTKSPLIRVPPPNFYILPIIALLPSIVNWDGHESLKTKKGHQIFQQQN